VRFVLAIGLGLNFVFLLCLLVGAILREDEGFWLNSGGYPVILRVLVRHGFYPLLCLALMILFGALLLLLSLRSRHSSLVVAGRVVAVFQLIIVAVVMVISFGSNIVDLIEG
jgi:hypothetical protein